MVCLHSYYCILRLRPTGYDTAAISGALVNIDQDLGDDLSDRQKVPIARLRWTLPDEIVVEQELITSATTFGALIGGLVAGALSDSIGRRPVIAIANVLFIFGALIQAVSALSGV